MPTYDPTGSPRLSADAAALPPEVLAAYADEAEALHGYAGTAYTGGAADQLVLASALQINRSLKLDTHGGGVLQQEEEGDQGYTVASWQGRVERLDPDAARIAARVLATPPDGAVGDSPAPLASTSTPIVFTW